MKTESGINLGCFELHISKIHAVSSLASRIVVIPAGCLLVQAIVMGDMILKASIPPIRYFLNSVSIPLTFSYDTDITT